MISQKKKLADFNSPKSRGIGSGTLVKPFTQNHFMTYYISLTSISFVLYTTTYLIFLCIYNYYYLFFRSRISAEECLNHPWLHTDTVHSEIEIDTRKLKRYLIKCRWIKAVNTIIALKRMGAKINPELFHSNSNENNIEC